MSNIFSNVIGRKLVMSLSGLFLVLFVIFHATMNLVVIFSPEAYDAICKFLGANWYALAATAVLAFGFFVHIIYSIILTVANKKARGTERYAMTSRPKIVSWASKNMFVLGVIVVGFAGLHMYQFWAKMQLVEIMYGHDWAMHTNIDPTMGSVLIKSYFANPIIVAAYVIWIAALWFHLTHGFWSALQTIGFSNQKWVPRLELAGKAIATLACGMFMIVVLVIYAQSLCA